MAGVAGQSLGSRVVFPGVASQVLPAPVLGCAAGIVARNHLPVNSEMCLAIVVGYGIEKAGGRGKQWDCRWDTVTSAGWEPVGCN